MDRLHHTWTGPTVEVDGKQVIGQLDYGTDEGQFARVTVSVVLSGANRLNRRWNHTLNTLMLKATEVSRVGDLVSFSVRGARHCLDRLVEMTWVKGVEWREEEVPHRAAGSGERPIRPESMTKTDGQLLARPFASR